MDSVDIVHGPLFQYSRRTLSMDKSLLNPSTFYRWAESPAHKKVFKVSATHKKIYVQGLKIWNVNPITIKRIINVSVI